MYKTLCIAVLLIPTFLFAQNGKSASAATLPGPVIVARGKVVNRSSGVPTTTIFTAKQTGLYRVSAYATITTADSTSQSNWSFDFGWTDDAGEQTEQGLLVGWGNAVGPFGFSNLIVGGAAYPFEALAGTPVTYTIIQQGSPDGSAYSLYYTVEQLQ
jgi:hypothetical protein